MNSTDLRKLPRTQIQAMARREQIKANGKTENIIRRLMKKLSGGVVTCAENVLPVSRRQNTNRHRPAARQGPPSGSGSQDPLPQVSSPPPKTAGPTCGDVRLALRDMTKSVDAIPRIRREIHEMELLLQSTAQVLKKVEQDTKELVWTRFMIEEDVLKRIKDDRTLWDGSRMMTEEERRRWVEHMDKKRKKRKVVDSKEMSAADELEDENLGHSRASSPDTRSQPSESEPEPDAEGIAPRKRRRV